MDKSGPMQATPKILVERFYHEVWNRADENLAREILHPEFRFRASLGPQKHGPDGFIAYMRSVHAALGNFTCIIDELLTTDDRAAARMTFTGIHQADLFDMTPTGRMITWTGGAFFTVEDGRIVELWVLGDIDSVKQQLGASTGTRFVGN